jgi:ABC-type nickel/cobalt efflux system permease component RcnA
VLATAGGLFPSPSALVVLVSAFTLGRAALGLALVGAFSLGLAATLTGVGLLLVYGKGLATRKVSLRRALRVFPLAGAGAIAAVGTVLVVQGASTIH